MIFRTVFFAMVLCLFVELSWAQETTVLGASRYNLNSIEKNKPKNPFSLFLGGTAYPNLTSETKIESQMQSGLVGLGIDGQSSQAMEDTLNWKAQGEFFWVSAEDYLYFDLPNLYSSYQVGQNSEISVGRKKVNWSLEDDLWHRGLWAPRNFYSLAEPMDQSLTGIYVDLFKRSKISMTLFASPLFIPDLGISFYEKDGGFVSYNPNFKPPGRSVDIIPNGVPVGLDYRMVDDSPGDIVNHPGAALKVAADLNILRMSLAIARKPMNQIPLNAPVYSLKNTTSLLANVTPTVFYHSLASLEVAANPDSKVRWGASVTYDEPDIDKQPRTTLQKNVDTTLIYTGFLKTRWEDLNSGLLISYSHLEGGDQPDIGQLSSRTDTRFPFRYQYTETVKLQWEQGFSFLPKLKLFAESNYDFVQKVSVSFLNVNYPLNRRMDVLLGYTHITLLSEKFSDPVEMYWHGYLDTDAFNLRLNYAF